MKQHNSHKIPKLGQHLLGVIAGPDRREYILGDLHEEFHTYASLSRGSSRSWYWKEVFRAIPGLMAIRIRQLNFRAIGLSVLLTIGAYLVLLLWGSYVIRPIMIGLRDGYPASHSINYMYLYLPVRLTGIFLVSAIMSLLVFRKSKSFKQNFFQYIGPLLILVSVPQIMFMLSAPDYELGEQISRLFFDGLVLIAGSAGGSWAKNRKRSK